MSQEKGPACWKEPRGLRTTFTTWPAPPQALQVEAVVPAFTPLPVQVPHSSNLLMLMSFLQSGIASNGWAVTELRRAADSRRRCARLQQEQHE